MLKVNTFKKERFRNNAIQAMAHDTSSPQSASPGTISYLFDGIPLNVELAGSVFLIAIRSTSDDGTGSTTVSIGADGSGGGTFSQSTHEAVATDGSNSVRTIIAYERTWISGTAFDVLVTIPQGVIADIVMYYLRPVQLPRTTIETNYDNTLTTHLIVVDLDDAVGPPYGEYFMAGLIAIDNSADTIAHSGYSGEGSLDSRYRSSSSKVQGSMEVRALLGTYEPADGGSRGVNDAITWSVSGGNSTLGCAASVLFAPHEA